MRRQADDMGLVEFYEYVCRRSGYVGMLQEKNDVESRGRLENVEELSSSIQAFLENDPENPTPVGLPGRGGPCIRTWTARRPGTTASR